MAFNFRNSAIEKTVLSFIMTDKTKIDNSDVIKNYPDGITITAFDIVNTVNTDTGEVENYGVYQFKENPNVFACAGLVLTGIFETWLSEFKDSVEASNELAKAGGVKIKLEESIPKKKTPVTKVTIL